MSNLTHRLAALFALAAVVFTIGSARAANYIPLPDGYTQHVYLEAASRTGSAFIDTEINATSIFQIEFGYCCLSASNWDSIVSGVLDHFTFGAEGGSTTKCYVRVRGPELAVRPTLSPVNSADPEFCNEIAITNNMLSVNGAKVCDCSTASALATSSGNVFIFNNSAKSRPSYGRIYYFRAYDSEGNLIANLVPATDSSNVPCLYDTVRGRDFRKDASSSGNFVAGPEVISAVGFYTSGAPGNIGVDEGVFYGKTNVTEGIVITVPLAVPFNNGNYVCTGYKLYEYTNGDYVEIPGRAGAGNSFTVTAADVGTGRKLVWQWIQEYKYTAHSYVQRNLIAQFDGIDNQGTGVHDPNATTWVDLTGNCEPLSSDALSFKDGNSAYLVNKRMTTTCPQLSTTYDAENGRSTVEAVGCMPVFAQGGDGTPRLVMMGNVGSIAWHSANKERLRILYRQSSTVRYFMNLESSVDANACQASVEMTRTLCQDGKYGYSFYANGVQRTGATYCYHDTASPNQDIAIGQDYAGFEYQLKSARFYSDQLTPIEIAYNAAIDQIRFFGADADTTIDNLGIRMGANGELEYYLAVDAGEDGEVQVTTNGVAIAAVSSIKLWIPEGTPVEIEYLPNTEGDWRLLSGAPAGAAYPTPSVVAFAMVPAKTAIAAVPYTYSDENVFSTVAPASVVTNYGALVVYSYATPTAEFAVFTKGPITLEERDGSYHALARNESFTITPSGPTTVLFSVGNNASRRFSFDPFDAYPIISGMATPEPAISLNDVALTKGVDYDLYYENATVPGAATMVIVGKAGTAAAGLAQRYGFTACSVRFVTMTGTGDGSDWANAMTLEEAVNGLANGTYDIWCAAGTYDLSGVGTGIVLPRETAIRGGFAADATDITKKAADGAKTVFNGGTVATGLFVPGFNIGTSSFAIQQVIFEDCVFTGCAGTVIKVYSKSVPFTFSSCEFVSNHVASASGSGAVVFYGNSCSSAPVTFTNCTFRANTFGDVCTEMPIVRAQYGVKLTIVRCLFEQNCIRVPNYHSTGLSYTGSIIVRSVGNGSTVIRDSVFRGNFLRRNYSCMRILSFEEGVNATVENCAFVGNGFLGTSYHAVSPSDNGVIYSEPYGGYKVSVRNCTFAYNLLDNDIRGCTVIYGGSAANSLEIENCIFWGNRCREDNTDKRDLQVGSATTVKYCLFEDTTQGIGVNIALDETNMAGDPKFVSGADALDPLLRAASAPSLVFETADETNLTAILALDAHLLSPAAYSLNDGTRVTGDDKAPLSPAIDAGDPASDYSNEPGRNGERINLGAYGNTLEASETPFAEPVLASPTVTYETDYTQPTINLEMGGEGQFNVMVTVWASADGETWIESKGFSTANGDTINWRVPAYFPVGGKIWIKSNYTFQGTGYPTDYESIDVDPTKVLPPWAEKGGDPEKIIHVREGATGKCDGTSWTDAFVNMGQAMRALSSTKNEMWIVGTVETLAADRATTFSYGYPIMIRGGFTGIEDKPEDRVDRQARSVITGRGVNDGLKISGAGAKVFENIVFEGGLIRGMALTSGSAAITNCVFRGNGTDPAVKQLDGRVLYVSGANPVRLSSCTFAENVITNKWGTNGNLGMLLRFDSSAVEIDDCLFVSNGVPKNITYWNTVLENCIGTSGFLISHLYGNRFVVRNTRFVANTCPGSWYGSPGMIDIRATGVRACFTNCLFLANEILKVGSGTYNNEGEMIDVLDCVCPTTEVVNCTFAYNSTWRGGAAMLCTRGNASGAFKPQTVIKNTIFAGNRTAEGIGHRAVRLSGDYSIDYSCFDSTNGLAGEVCSMLTNAANCNLICDPGLYSTTNDFKRIFLSTDGGHFDWTNSVEAASLNVHLVGRGGYIDEITGEKVAGSGKPSPCVDKGDPASPYKRETKPRGYRVNMGFYGNTPYQTQTTPGMAVRVR